MGMVVIFMVIRHQCCLFLQFAHFAFFIQYFSEMIGEVRLSLQNKTGKKFNEKMDRSRKGRNLYGFDLQSKKNLSCLNDGPS